MRNLLAVLIFIAGVVLSLYTGVYLMLFKGIVEIVDALNQSPIPAKQVAWGAVKIIFCEVGAIFFLISYYASIMIAGTGGSKRKKLKFKKERK